MDHQELVDIAGLVLDEVYSDTSVSPETTRDSLELLRGQIDSMLAALDIEARNERETDNAALGAD